jgi:methylmalonyl-CoA mutase N-terminal domain/subunit
MGRKESFPKIHYQINHESNSSLIGRHVMTKKEIRQREREWKEGTVKKALKRFPFLKESPSRFYTPLDMKKFDFLEKIGFPGEYPFTAGTYAFDPTVGLSRFAAQAPSGSSGRTRAAMYSGYGTSEDTRDYYQDLINRGGRGGPNLAMDLPTQCGYDSDNPMIEGEVGKVGVAIDSLRDFEIIYEPYQGDLNLDNISSNYTMNAAAIYLMALYAALAENRGIPLEKLKATPQNDVLKEYIARGTYIFPPTPAMRLFRDTLVFLNKHMPSVNITSIGGYHIREAGATRKQDLAYSMAIAIAYFQEGIDAGLDIDAFAPRFTFNAFGGSMELLEEIAFQRAARRMYARILKERFGAKNPRSMIIRQPITAHIGPSDTTIQRPLNNLTRAVVGAIAGALSGGRPAPFPPYDEPLGLGWSREAQQLSNDAGRIGSYAMEAITDEIEAEAWDELNKIEEMGGAVAAIESGYMAREVSRSAYERQKSIASGETLVVGVNCFTGDDELEVETTRLVPHPYDPTKRERAEKKQIADVLRDIFGEYESPNIL